LFVAVNDNIDNTFKIRYVEQYMA